MGAVDAPTLTEDERDACIVFAAEHGLAALLDHLGLDELGNEIDDLHRRLPGSDA
jgi:hypothetical protein